MFNQFGYNRNEYNGGLTSFSRSVSDATTNGASRLATLQGHRALIRGISDDMDVLMQREYTSGVGYVFIDGRDAMQNSRNPKYSVRCYQSGYDWATDTRGERALDKFEVTRQDLRW